MRSKCSFILKASTALVLALLMLFSTMATSIAAVVENADTGAQADLAETGAVVTVYLDNTRGWSEIYAYAGVSIWKDDSQGGQVKNPGTPVQMQLVTGETSIYSCSINIANSNNRIAFSNHNYGDNSFYSDGNPWYESVYRDDFNSSTPKFTVGDWSWNSWNNSYWGGSWSAYTPPATPSISLSANKSTAYYEEGDTVTLTPDVQNSSATATYTVKKDGSSATVNTDYTLVGNEFTPKVSGSFEITASITDGSTYTDSVTVNSTTRKVLLKTYKGSSTKTEYTMTYDSSKSLYKYSVSWSANSTYQVIIWDPGANSGNGMNYSKFDANAITTSYLTSGSGYDLEEFTMNTGDSYWDDFQDISTTGASTYVVYYSASTHKFYIEYPVAMTTKYVKGPTYNAANTVDIATTYIAYNTVFAQPSNPTAPTGYTFETNGWYTDNECTTKASFTSARTANATFYAKMVAKQATVTFNTNGATANGTQTVSGKATYGVAMPSFTTYTAPTKTGYSLDGWYDAATSGTKYYNADGTSAKSWDKNTTDSTPLYAHWTEVKAGATVKAYTNSTASSTGGTVKVGTSGTPSGTVTISDDSFGIDTASPAIIKASTATGYEFKGWQFNSTHLKYSFDGKTYTAVASTTTTYGTSSNTTVYLKTDGTSGMTTANTEVHAMFESAKYTITYSGKYTDDGTTSNDITATQGTFTVTNNSDSGANVASGSTVAYQNKLTVTATPAEGYVVDGIYYKTTADGTWNKMTTATNASTGAVYNNNFNVESNWFFEARFKKIYHLSLYNTTEPITGGFRYLSGPPMRVTVTDANDNVTTYTYKKNAAATSEGNTRTSGDYNEGDLLTVYAGDTIVLTYSALASSDTITGVFFNNDRRYTCEGEDDNLYKLREYNASGWGTEGDDSWDYDYAPTTTLYANANYYEGENAETITAQKANYQAKDGVDNNMHTVTFVAKSDYLNIDLELATKRQFIFTDTTGLDIRSEMMDNYYNPLSEVSASTATTKFGIKLATSDTCTYDWGTGAKVKFYRDAACTNEVTGVFTVASSADANGYFVISGTMPNYNVYIKPNIVTNYNLYLGGRMISDTFGNFDSPGDVAYYYVNNSTGENHLLTGKADTTNTSASAVAQGTTVQLSFTFKTRAQMGWSGTGSAPADMYSFIGWYKGTADGPDYSKGQISTKETFNFIPKANTYIYAVTTRDVYINGSKNITGASVDWNNASGTDTNFLMSFDPDYTNPDGGLRGRYYWVVKPEWFNASGTNGVGDFQMGTYQSDSTPYWENNDSNHGNSFFQIRDEATGDNKSLWTGIEPYVSDKGYIKFAKIDPRDWGDHSAANAAGLGVIKFKESDAGSKGYTSPITIYYYPGKGFSVEPTPMFSNLYVSNGFTVGGTTNNTNDTSVTAGTGESFTVSTSGSGWPTNIEDKAYVEGTVKHYIPEKKNAKVKISKTVSSTEKVVAFDIYDLDNDKFYSRTDVTADSNTYSFELQVTMQQNLYIIPIIQEKTADLTINFDGTQLNKTQWGDVVSCYAWYGNGKHSDGNNYDALGAYPGQPMIVSDDGNTWTATIPSKKTIGGTEYSLSGILFANYVDGERSWLGRSGVMGSVSDHTTGTATGGLINVYNHISSGDNGEYSRTNFKAQTYDYREPVAIYANESHEEGVETTITFAMKDGNSSLVSWRHSELVKENVLTGSWASSLSWEYLTNSSGKKYSDLNGKAMDDKPTATYYVAAKGQVIYKNSVLQDVFFGGKDYEATNNYSSKEHTGTDATKYGNGWSGSITYGGATGVDFDYAVQWYVYDAQGNYITNVLSAAIADQVDGMSYIAKQLDDLGYATDGKSVAICYDKPRYMYSDDGSKGCGINSGDDFSVYRFEGQWYSTVKTEPVTVSVGVGMMTENGEVLAATNHPGYGDAYAEYDTTYGTASSFFAPVVDGDKSVTVAIADANKRLVKLHAKEQNFIGWYYYDANTGEFTKASYTSHEDFYPNFNADVTYYAMYAARAVYQYKYTGRETNTTGDFVGTKTKVYTVDGGAMSDKEMDGTEEGCSGANTVSKTARTDFTSKSPTASDVKIFKKDIIFNTVTSGMLDNSAQYIMNITNATVTDAKFTITAHYKLADGSWATPMAIEATYNTPVDFTVENGGTTLPSIYAGHKFIGWYECNSSGALTGELLSTQANYGMVVVKDQHILAVYEGDGNGKTISDTDAFSLYIDDHEITREKYSATSGYYYNDTIVRLRNDSTGNLTALPNGAEVGILVINANDSGQTTVVSNQDNLINFANGLDNGATKAIGTKGRTVTKVSTTTLNTFGRADLAVRSDYASADGKAYSVYAYYKDSSGNYTFKTVRESGTYTIG